MQTNAEDTSFYQVPKTLFRARYFVSPKTGEHVKLSPNEKAVYTVLLDRFTFFKSQGNQHYDTQEFLADESGVQLRTTHTILAKFLKHEVIEVRETRTAGGHKKLIYVSVKPLVLPTQTKETSKTASIPALDMPSKAPKSPVHARLDQGATHPQGYDETHQLEPLDVPDGEYEFIRFEGDDDNEDYYEAYTPEVKKEEPAKPERVLQTMVFDEHMGMYIDPDELERQRLEYLNRHHKSV